MPINSSFGSAVAIPIANDGKVHGDAAQAEDTISFGSDRIQFAVAVVVQDPQETRTEDSDLGAAISVPVANDWNIAGLGAGKCIDAVTSFSAVEAAIAVEVEVEHALAIDAQLGATVA